MVFLEELLLGKTVFSIRQKGVPPLLLPASVLQLPRCLVRICNLFHRNNQVANWQVSRNAIAAGKTCCKYNLLRKCGLLAHTSPTFLKNCWIKKLLVACGSYVAAYFFSTNIKKADAPFQQVFKNLWKEHPLYCFIFSECFY